MAIKFKTDKQNLLSLILPAASLASSKSTLPALEGILLSLDGNTLSICGYDLEKGVQCKGEVFSSEDGEIIVNAQKIAAIVKSMPEGEISFECKSKDIVEIKGNMSDFSIQGLSANAYPNLPSFGGKKSFSIEKETVKNLIQKTYFAVSQNDARPILMGEYIELEENEIKIVSLDNFRLALRTKKSKLSSTEEKINFVVPGKSLIEFSKLIEDNDDPVKIEVSEKHIVMSFDNKVFFSRLLEGEFIDYERALPKANKISVKINKEDLISSVERAALIVDEKLRTPIRCNFSGNDLIISCSTSHGSVNEVIAIEKEGPDIEIGFNYRYLLDALRNADDDILTLGMSTPNLSMVISGESEEKGSYTYLVLPCHLK